MEGDEEPQQPPKPPAGDAGGGEEYIRKIFDVTDVNQDGFVSLQELHRMVEHIRHYDVMKKQEVFRFSDLATDDSLNYDEFRDNILPLVEAMGIPLKDCLTKLTQKWLGSELVLMKELFEVVDLDSGGSITKDELREMMSVLKPGMTDLDILKAMNAADTDGGGDIDFDEFTEFIANAKLDQPLPEAIDNLREAFDLAKQRLEKSRSFFGGDQKEKTPSAKLTPAAAARLKRERRRAELIEDSSLNQLLAVETAARKAIVDEEEDSWSMLASSAGRTLGERAAAEQMERERDRERKRRDFLVDGGHRQRGEIADMKEKRGEEEKERRAKRQSEQRFKLQDRLAAQESHMLCFGQQFKVLRQYLGKGCEQVRLEAEREFGDIHKTLPKYSEEVTGGIDRIESMITTVGRALMQESMTMHGDRHRSVLQEFEGNRDFTWLRGSNAVDRSTYVEQLRQHRVSHAKMTAAYVNFTDPSNLHGEHASPNLELTAKQTKKYLWAAFKHYLSSGGGMTFSDFQKLVADCKVDVAGSLVVLWNKALGDTADCQILGLQRRDTADYLKAGGAASPDRADFHQFVNLIVLLACERYIASPATSAEYKLECFLLHELLPLLPHEVLLHIGSAVELPESPLALVNDSFLPTIPILLETHYTVIKQVSHILQRHVTKFLESRLTQRARAEEQRKLAEGLLTPEQVLASLGLMVIREPLRLPSLQLSSGAKQAVRGLMGDHGRPVLPLRDVLNFVTYRAPAIGRQAVKDALVRALNETLAATYPTLPSPGFNVETSREPVPFPLFLSLIVKTATYTSIAAAVPPPPPAPTDLTPASYQVYAFLQLLTHSGHYVLNL
eukprot:TRINITY_DN21117_c0_g1_i1.p1 TRINITY_DN21117_c0_g1~~TRINITY_DN21117_c0_g1_i1.p1  ORF type:complete len:842 (+),score=328.46 TRINITY_DN21117_c0_g1_i1:183-2708(+)